MSGKETSRPDPRWWFAVGACALLQAVVFAIWHATDRFWGDEAFTAELAMRPFAAGLRRATEDSHPPLFWLLVWSWLRVVGHSEALLRLLPLAFSIAVLPGVFLIARRLAGEAVAAFAVVLVALSPFHLWYAAELRNYSLLECLAVWSTVALLQVRDRIGSGRGELLRAAVLYGVSVALLFATHFFSVFTVMAHVVFVALVEPRKRWKLWMGVFAAACATLLPWVPLLFRISGGSNVDWLAGAFPSQNPKAVLITAFRFVAGEAWPVFTANLATVAGAAICAAFGAGAAVMLKRGRSDALMVLLAAAVPPVVLSVVSMIRPLYFPRYVLHSLPFFFAVAACGVLLVPRGWPRVAAGALLAGLLAAQSWVVRDHRPFHQWGPIIAELEAAADAAGEPPVVVPLDFVSGTTVRYYQQRRPDWPEDRRLRFPPAFSQEVAPDPLPDRAWIILNDSRHVPPDELPGWLADFDRVRTVEGPRDERLYVYEKRGVAPSGG